MPSGVRGAPRTLSVAITELARRGPRRRVDLVVLHSISLPPGSTAATHRAAVREPARLGGASVLRDDPRPDGVVAFPHPSRRRAGAVRLVRRPRLACRTVVVAGREAAMTSRSASSSKGSRAGVRRARSTRCWAACSAVRSAIRSSPVAGHEHVAPGRKNDPGSGFDWARLRRLLARRGASLRGLKATVSLAGLSAAQGANRRQSNCDKSTG